MKSLFALLQTLAEDHPIEADLDQGTGVRVRVQHVSFAESTCRKAVGLLFGRRLGPRELIVGEVR